jgi:hypothetical protein
MKYLLIFAILLISSPYKISISPTRGIDILISSTLIIGGLEESIEIME